MVRAIWYGRNRSIFSMLNGLNFQVFSVQKKENIKMEFQQDDMPGKGQAALL